jgi:hypothetical protein
MSSWIALFVSGLIFPALWGVLVHRAVTALWPSEKRRTLSWTETNPNECPPEFFDYQI